MPKRLISYLKQQFSVGKKPTAEDYGDVFDSFVHKDDLAAVNAADIDERINNYNTALRAVTPGVVDTLGDVLQILSGYPANWNLKEKLDAAGGQKITWANVTNKPTNLTVSWTEQRLYLLDKIDRPTSIPTSYTGKSVRTLFVNNSNLPSNAKIVIVDLELLPVLVNWAMTTQSIMVLTVVAATIGITPKADLA